MVGRYKLNNHLYAMKFISKNDIFDEEELDRILTEKYVLENISSPFVINLKFCF